MVGLALALALVVALVICLVVLVVGRRTGLVDRPDGELKTHTGAPVPLGGVAVLVAVQLGLVIGDAFDLQLLLASLVVLFLGLVDDVLGLSPRVRLIGAVVAGIVLVIGSESVVHPIGRIAAIGLVTVAVNAVNLLDGLDALAGSVSAVAAMGLASFAALGGVPGAWAPLTLTLALVGFLAFNYPPAKLYLGDNGAYVVGLTLAWAVLLAGADWAGSIVAVALIGVPFLDLAVTVLRRWRQGKPLFAGDRDHSYDRLRSRDWSVVGVVTLFVAIQGVWAAVLILTSWKVGDLAAVTLALVLGGALSLYAVFRADAQVQAAD
ncbi:MAG: MraY family glycosyltransferase [Acidimicrobiia bacterium]